MANQITQAISRLLGGKRFKPLSFGCLAVCVAVCIAPLFVGSAQADDGSSANNGAASSRLTASSPVVKGQAASGVWTNKKNVEMSWSLANDGTLTISGNGEMSKPGQSDDFGLDKSAGSSYDAWIPEVPWKAYINDVTSVVIEEGVTSIGDQAFRKHVNLTAVVVQSNALTKLGKCAFYNDRKLTTLDLSSCTSMTTIGSSSNESPFTGCEDLEKILLPASLTKIPKGLFALQGSNLQTVNLSDLVNLTSIEEAGFRREYGSGSKEIKDLDGQPLNLAKQTKLETIGKNAFRNQTGLSSSLTIGSAVLSTIDEGAFSAYESKYGVLESVDLSACKGLKNIGANAFLNQKELKSITFPNAFTWIDKSAFTNTGLGLNPASIAYCVGGNGALYNVKADGSAERVLSGGEDTLYWVPTAIGDNPTATTATLYETGEDQPLVNAPSLRPETGKYSISYTLNGSPVTGTDPPEAKDSGVYKVGYTVTLPDGATTKSGTITITIIKTYPITVENGTADPSRAAADATVQVKAKAPAAGMLFDKWTSEDGVTFASASSPITTFTMPAESVTVTANYKGKAKIIVAVKKDGMPQAQDELADGLSLVDEEGLKQDVTFTYSQEDKAYVFDPATTKKDLPSGNYVLCFGVAQTTGSAGYPATSVSIEYQDDAYAASTEFNYYTVSLAKDPAYTDAIGIGMEAVSDANVLPGSDTITACALAGATINIKTTPATGYHFDGYSYQGTAPTWDPSKAEQVITVRGACDIMAHVAPNAYTVHFDANKDSGVTGEMADQDMVYDEPQALSANQFDWVGGSFVSWNTAADGSGTSYTDKESVKNLTAEDGATVTLYAQWQRYEYTVEFVNYDGTVLQSGKVPYGETPAYSGETPTKPETAQYLYVFRGWNPEVVAATGDATYTAEYEPVLRLYTVTWLDEDGTELEQSLNVPYGQVPEYEGADPTKPDDGKYTYVFDGWTPEVEAVTGDATYTAVYKAIPKKATLTFDLAGGTLDGKTGVVTILANVGDTVKLPDAPTREGYTFKYWKGSEYAAGADYTVEGDHVFTAEWEKNAAVTHTVTFDANGHGTAPAAQEVEDGKRASRPANPTASGYTFGGWFTDKSCEESYDFSTPVTEDITLYAKWTKKSSSGTSGKSGTSAKAGDPFGGAIAVVLALATVSALAMALSRRRWHG